MENVVTSSWRGRKVLLTGHTGFKGGWLALLLARKGAIVRGYSLDPSTNPSLFQAARIGEVMEDIRGDIRDLNGIHQAMQEFAPEAVFHLAAQPLVRRSYAEPVETYATNVLGTAHVLESIRNTPSVRAAVVVTSDKCYENQEWYWGYRETDRLGGHDPYSSSKACAEIVCSAYRNSYFSSERAHEPILATGRSGNVIGGGDWSEDRIVPDLIRGFLSSEPVLIRNPGSVRPWQHVLEPLAGYLMLAERALEGEANVAGAWNFGPEYEDGWPVEQIAQFMADRWGNGASWVKSQGVSVHEARYLKLDASKAHQELGWRPRLQLDTALNWVVDWYREWQRGADMQDFTLRQISEYEALGSIH